MQAAVLALYLLLGQAQPEGVRVIAKDDGTRVEVIAALPEKSAAKLAAGKWTQDDGEGWLQLHLVQEGKEGPAILGSYERRGQDLVFVPRFPLQPEKAYRARFTAPATAAIVIEYNVPARKAKPAPEVAAIWPTSDVLPANHLRFYIEFSQPMLGGEELFNQIEILDAQGNPVFDPWLPDELWDDSGKVLTLYIHPGRIKWGVLLRDLLGPVLEPKRTYTLVIRGSLLDAEGRKLGKDTTKKFKTTDEDRARLELSSWKVTPPRLASKEAIKLTFPKALDQFGAQQFLKVTDVKGQPVAGKVEVARDGRSWSLLPAEPWTEQDYKVVVDERLEDTAGNTPVRAFDMDNDAPVPARQVLTLAFRAKK